MNNNLNKVTYILGAGASANALPTVRESATNIGFTNSLRQLSIALKTDTTIDVSYYNFRDELCEDLNWLADMGDRHSTIDTFALYCYKSGDNKSFSKLKTVLELYFTIKQFIEKKVDNRYLPFITNCLDGRREFCENIKILNWNYDYQVQLASENYHREDYVVYAHTTSHLPPLVRYYPAYGSENYSTIRNRFNEPSMIHLNGIAGFYEQGETRYTLSYFLNGNLRDLNHLIEKITRKNEHRTGYLTFAFEFNGVITETKHVLVKQMIDSTDYLVIVGYSFPLANLATDKIIFDTLIAGGLKGIYFQDLYNPGDFLRDIFNIPNDIFIKNERNVDTFYIPREAKLPRKVLQMT